MNMKKLLLTKALLGIPAYLTLIAAVLLAIVRATADSPGFGWTAVTVVGGVGTALYIAYSVVVAREIGRVQNEAFREFDKFGGFGR